MWKLTLRDIVLQLFVLYSDGSLPTAPRRHKDGSGEEEEQSKDAGAEK
jgi:hypothetical protein